MSFTRRNTAMKKFYKISIILLITTLFTSCIRVETVIKVNKDGSGTITEKVMMSKVFADMMRSLGESFGSEEEQTKPFSLFDKEKLAKQALDYGDGVTYQSGKELKERDWEGYSATYTFTDISKVKLNTSQDDKVDTGMTPPSSDEDKKEEEEFYYFTFEKGNTPKLIINRSEIELDDNEDEDEASEADEMGEMDAMGNEMMKMFEGMRFSMTVEVDGKISNTNASYRNGSSVTLLNMDFGKMMKNKDAFTELTRKKPETTAEMRSFMEKFDGLQLELEKPVTISFR